MRSLTALFALVSSCACAQTPLVKILSDELDRNFTILKQKGDPPPYFMSYEVTSTDSYVLVASRGSLETQQNSGRRPFFIGGCHSWRTNGPIVADKFPQFATRPVAED